MKNWRVVLDTNVLVAAARSRNGASHALVAALARRRFRALASVPLMLEYEAVLKRPEHRLGRTMATIDAFLDALTLFMEPVPLYFLWRPQLHDPADEMVLETAINGSADAIVTLNVRDFQKARSFGIACSTPGAFWKALHRRE